MTKICWKFGTRPRDCDASGSTTTRKLPPSRQWLSLIWMSFSWTLEVQLFKYIKIFKITRNVLQFPNFKFILGDNVDCWMEIQHGKGPWAPPVSGIVPLGSTLTLVVAINDYRGNCNRFQIV